MPRPRRPHITRQPLPPGPLVTAHLLDTLTPTMRAAAMRMADGDVRRIRVLRRNAFEVLAPTPLER